MASILNEIFANKSLEVAARKQSLPLEELRLLAEQAPPALDFAAALRRRPQAAYPALIAEVKCASPSRGVLSASFDPLRLARIYAKNGASAISVLTDERYFKGRLDYLRQIASDLKNGSNYAHAVPLLCKDFIMDPYQVYEARLAGADALLLITAALPAAVMQDLHSLAISLGMQPLVEVHNLTELDQALTCTPILLGINNRDLHSFTTDLDTTLRLIPHIPPNIGSEICLVAESGIHTPEDARRLASAGVDAILVGEALVTAADVPAKVRSLAGG